MLPRIFDLLRADSVVTALLGTSPMRCYRHGAAPQNVAAPYVTEFVVTALPANQLSGLPPVDTCRLQVSCWSVNAGTGATGINAIASAVRVAIEARWHIDDVRDMGQDAETMRFRVDFDVTVFDHSPP